tara:strand:- start:7696 stop:9471 length:1776 start_codon:yes stop_codon:yes gene_type:complete
MKRFCFCFLCFLTNFFLSAQVLDSLNSNEEDSTLYSLDNLMSIDSNKLEDTLTTFYVLDNFLYSPLIKWRLLNRIDTELEKKDPIWGDLSFLIASLGGVSYNPVNVSNQEDQSFVSFLSSGFNSITTGFRKGPLPLAEWLYSGAHGRGQSFGIRASASANMNQHYDLRFVRSQATGTLLGESYGRDDLIFKNLNLSHKLGISWKGLLRYQVGKTNETGGVLNMRQLDSNYFNLNRELAETRWSANEVLSHHESLDWNWVFSSLNDQNNRFRYHIRLDGFNHKRIFHSQIMDIDTLQSRKIRSEFSISGKFFGFEGSNVSIGIQNRKQKWNSNDSLIGIKWDPYVILNSGSLNLEYRLLTNSYKFQIKKINFLEGKVSSFFSAGAKQPPFWSGLRDYEIYQEGSFVFRHQNLFQIVYSLKFSKGDNILHVNTNSDLGVWTSRERYNVSRLSVKGRMSDFLKYELCFSSTNGQDIGIAPWFGKILFLKEWSLNNQITLISGIDACGWAGLWNRPFFIPERGTFGFDISQQQTNKRFSGLISPFIGVRFSTEAEFLVNFQNANQGWTPNTVFLVQNYPSPPLSIRITGRWRMFN